MHHLTDTNEQDLSLINFELTFRDKSFSLEIVLPPYKMTLELNI